MNLASLAIKQALNGNYETASKVNRKILKEDSQNIEALNRLALAYLHLGKKDKAQALYRKVLRLDRFNPIAKRNLEKLKDISPGKKDGNSQPISEVDFLEEPGKTQQIILVSPGEIKILARLNASQPLRFTTKGKAICLYSYSQEYIGRLPDDLSRRLILLIKRGNQYQAHVKSSEKNRVIVFLKEVKQAKINLNYISFPENINQAYTPLV